MLFDDKGADHEDDEWELMGTFPKTEDDGDDGN